MGPIVGETYQDFTCRTASPIETFHFVSTLQILGGLSCVVWLYGPGPILKPFGVRSEIEELGATLSATQLRLVEPYPQQRRSHTYHCSYFIGRPFDLNLVVDTLGLTHFLLNCSSVLECRGFQKFHPVNQSLAAQFCRGYLPVFIVFVRLRSALYFVFRISYFVLKTNCCSETGRQARGHAQPVSPAHL